MKRILVVVSLDSRAMHDCASLAEDLCVALRGKNRQADLVTLPYHADTRATTEQFVAYRMLDFENHADELITIGLPASAVKHPAKTAWLPSLTSSVHERWDTHFGTLAMPHNLPLRDEIWTAERAILSECQKVFCFSGHLQKVVKAAHGIESQVLRPPSSTVRCSPSLDPDLAGQFFLHETRLQPFERTDLLLNAVSRSEGKWKLAVFIPYAELAYREYFETLLHKLSIADRVGVFNGYAGEHVIAGSLAVIHIPAAVLVEGAIAGKAISVHVPVVTCEDAVGVIESRGNSCVSATCDAASIASVLDGIAASRKKRKRLKTEALQSRCDSAIWNEIVERLG